MASGISWALMHIKYMRERYEKMEKKEKSWINELRAKD